MNEFDNALVKKIEVGFSKSDIRIPLNMRKNGEQTLSKAAEEGGTLVMGMKIPKGNKFDAMLLINLMAEKILLTETMKIYEADLDKTEKIYDRLGKVQEEIDAQIIMSDGRGLLTEEGCLPQYTFSSAFESKLKSLAADKCDELIKSFGDAQSKKGKAGETVKEIDKFPAQPPNKVKIKDVKNKDAELGAFKEEEEKDKKVKEYKGKKGNAAATVSTKKASCPDKSDATKKVSGAKAEHMKPAIRLVIDDSGSDKQIPHSSKGKPAMMGVAAKEHGEAAMKEDHKKDKMPKVTKSLEEESGDFNKSLQEGYVRLNKSMLKAPRTK